MVLRATQQHISVLAEGDGKLRATQQHVSVLAPGSGKARVTRQYIEVLYSVPSIHAVTSTIGINHDVTFGNNINKSETSTIGISHDIGLVKKQTMPGTNTLVLSQTVFISPHHEDISQSISLTDVAHVPSLEQKWISDLIDLGQVVSYTVKPDIYEVEQTIGVWDIADTTTHGRTCEHTLDLIQTATGEKSLEYPIFVEQSIDIWDYTYRGGTVRVDASTSLTHSILETVQMYDGNGNPTGLVTVVVEDGLRQSVDISGTYNDYDDGHHIPIRDTVSYLKIPFIGTDKSATTTLSLSQGNIDSLGVSNSLTIIDIASAWGATGADHSDLNITQVVDWSFQGQRDVVDTIGVTQGVSYYVVGDICGYEINIGSTTETGLPPEPTEPTIVPVDRISFAYPAAAPTTTLYFNAPEFGNLHEVYQRRIDRLTRGGKRIVYRDSSWREHEVFKITITCITEAETMNLLTFLKNSTGSPVKYTDYNSIAWTVIILNPDERIVRDKIGNTIGLEMQTI